MGSKVVPFWAYLMGSSIQTTKRNCYGAYMGISKPQAEQHGVFLRCQAGQSHTAGTRRMPRSETRQGSGFRGFYHRSNEDTSKSN